MAKAKREPVDDLPPEKPVDGGEADAPEVAVAAVTPSPAPAPPPRPRAKPGYIRIRASQYFKDGQILGPGKAERPYVKAEEIIEVTPETYRQLRESAPGNWTVL